MPEGRPRHAGALLDPAPERDAARGRACARRAFAQHRGRMPAHGRRLRRQGIAVGAVVRPPPPSPRRKTEAPGQAARRPRRRHARHRQAPLLPLRVRSRLRRRRPHPGRQGRHGHPRRLLGRPVRPGRHARRLPLRQYLLPVRRRHPRRLRQDQHPVEHRLPRLRRAAGRDRHRIRDRRDRAQPRARCARHPAPEFLRRRQDRNVTPYGQIVDRQRHPRTGRRAGSRAATTARGARRSPPSTAPARC